MTTKTVEFPPYSFGMVKRSGKLFIRLDDVKDWLAMVEAVCKAGGSHDATELARVLRGFLDEVRET